MIRGPLKASHAIALASLCALLAPPAIADTPVADGMSEERHGVVTRIDVNKNNVVLEGREYRLVEGQASILQRILSDSSYDKLVDDNLDLRQIRSGSRVRYMVDAKTEQFEDRAPDLFILGIE